MKAGLIVLGVGLFLVSFPGLLRAETYDMQGRLLPTDTNESGYCQMAQTLLKPGAKVVFLRMNHDNSSKVLPPNPHDFWTVVAVPAYSQETEKYFVFSRDIPGVPSGYTWPSRAATESLPSDQAQVEKYLDFVGKSCHFQKESDRYGYKFEMGGNDAGCVAEQTAVFLSKLQDFGVGQAQFETLRESKNEPFINFYQQCHKVIHQGSVVKFADNLFYSMKRFLKFGERNDRTAINDDYGQKNGDSFVGSPVSNSKATSSGTVDQ